MMVISLGWMLKCLFSCGHWRTPVNEGKCYCPDCGEGVIYQWVVVRCDTCRVRVDSRLLLRQLMPVHRCCPACGERAFRFEYLEFPSYFHLHKAQLVIREEQDYLQGRFAHWSLYSVGEAIGRAVEKTMENGMSQARYWLANHAKEPVPVLLPAPIHR